MDKRDNQFKATVNDELQYKMPPPPSKKNIISDKKSEYFNFKLFKGHGWKHFIFALLSVEPIKRQKLKCCLFFI